MVNERHAKTVLDIYFKKNKAPEREKTLTFRFVILKMDVKYERDEG